MKKRISCLLLAFLLLAMTLPGLADSPNAWLTVITSDRVPSRSGPGTQYDGTGSYHKAGTQMLALTKAWDSRNGIWWVQVELTYSGRQRRVYTGQQRLYVDLDLLPEETEVGGGRTTASATAYYGPGTQYAGMKDNVPKGVECSVYNYEGGYVQVQYKTGTNTLRRAWIKQSAFKWSWGPVSNSGNSGYNGNSGNNYNYGGYTVSNPFYMASPSTYVKVYPEYYVTPYTSSSLSTRGTENKPSGSALISPNDDVYILGTGSGWARVSYPANGGRVTAYVSLYDLTPNNAAHEVRTASGKFYLAPHAGDALNGGYNAGRGDVMVVVGQNGSRYQIIYPVSNGKYRMAWCEISDFYANSY